MYTLALGFYPIAEASVGLIPFMCALEREGTSSERGRHGFHDCTFRLRGFVAALLLRHFDRAQQSKLWEAASAMSMSIYGSVSK